MMQEIESMKGNTEDAAANRRQLASPTLTGYTGVRVERDKAILQLGKSTTGVSLYRSASKQASFAGHLTMVNGLFQFTSQTQSCSSTKAGSVRYDKTKKTLMVCNGASWTTIGGTDK